MIELVIDVDECTQPYPPPCFGRCINTIGSYDCICPSGTSGNPRVKDGCSPSKLKFAGNMKKKSFNILITRSVVYRVKYNLQPSTCAKVRFSTFNYKTDQQTPSNYQNRTNLVIGRFQKRFSIFGRRRNFKLFF